MSEKELKAWKKKLEREMQEATAQLYFERAIELRDKIKEIEKIMK